MGGDTMEGSQSGSPVRQPIVLLVDDQRLIRSSVRRVLRFLPIQIQEAASAEEALLWLEAQDDVSVVISDFHLGAGMTGLELLAQVQAKRPHTWCLLHTAAEHLVIQLEAETWLTLVSKNNLPEVLRRLVSAAIGPS